MNLGRTGIAMKTLAGLVLFSAFGVALARAESWVDKIKLYGDLRYRLEDTQSEGAAGYAYQDRQRLRARFGASAQMDECWKGEIRLTTGEPGAAGAAGDPISGNQTLGDLGSRKPVWIDAAFIEYKFSGQLGTLAAGKLNSPFEAPGKSQLVWNGNFVPEGVAGKFALSLSPEVSVFLIGGGFWMRENKSGSDPMLYGAQTVAKLKAFGDSWTVGCGYFLFTDLTHQAPFDPTGTAAGKGNTVVNGTYQNNFTLSQAYLEYSTPAFGLPVLGYLDYVYNHGALRFNRGYLAGCVVNKAKTSGSWEAGYNFRQVQKDAALGAFADSDFVGGGTNGDGHMLTAAYAITDQVKTCAYFFRDRKNLDAVPAFFNRFQAEVLFSF